MALLRVCVQWFTSQLVCGADSFSMGKLVLYAAAAGLCPMVVNVYEF